MKNTFVLLWVPGPSWIEGKTVREQPYWTQHADFMDPLFANGTVVLGGPFAHGLRNEIEKTRSDSHDYQQGPEGQLRKGQRSGSLLRAPWERAAAGGASRLLLHHRGFPYPLKVRSESSQK